MKIAVTGATGLVGQALSSRLESRGDEVAAITRSPRKESDIGWSPSAGELDEESLRGFDAVVHLAGENIASGLWTQEKKRRIKESRINSTELLARKLAAIDSPPPVLVCASAIGFYGDRGNEVLTETSSVGTGFLADTCIAWEQAADPARQAGIRVVHGRLGLVTTPKGGALQKMLTPFKLGVGGVVGSGEQYMSWIGLDDLVSAFVHAIDQSDLNGPVNFTAPNPVTNREFTRTLAQQLNRPAIFRIPTFVVRTGLGSMGEELLLASTRVVPKTLQDSGFQFSYPTLAECLDSCLH